MLAFEKQRIVEVTSQELMALVESPNFLVSLDRAARTTRRSGYETGFRLYRDVIRRRDYFTPVFKGGADEIPADCAEKWKETSLPAWPTMAGCFDLLRLHFHPEHGEPLALSCEDILSVDGELAGFVSVDGRLGGLQTISGIGSIDDAGKGNVLLLQRETQKEINLNARDVIHQCFHNSRQYMDLWPDDSYAQALEVPGYIKSGILRFALAQPRGPPSIENSNVMARFAYSARTAI